ncbi:NADPH-dependent 7-cyano-7-deazaguanine reductase QueF [Pseudoalteromonas peptidolytica]|uniref:NADPH-dependent 7-cyano-7-deazaguanine reductase n=1 Tax=Pseudoalteromonas peptidolytica F12-50-A1 TaxID=1315280 RepID=A0A8I0MTR2_9GAMM|nr:NADPH-dependent 7-cyano-7-deazaguanine reductase QueF [Pseudoalteromonas peptidolytica]MBE0345697.1 7-cyano-7-deazaguanine reductase [Pseudoalteromonas peptidolytica F12-50-A1]NLR14317.1 NADPH-dependent 7-cyano-7-deazaguanine reductase QueF [Pseudoalteromonas peptidolytica]GEK09228.1 NADPH-dependent 7-cyano-7-deazaguanine reductase [Pseudoalteromonas peptidolytica]
MTDYNNSPELQSSVLGKTTEYASIYTPSLLHPIARKLNRDQIHVDETELPFKGEDTWTGYELSWLNTKGKPQVAVATFVFPCQSSHIIESKSFKLYLNSFNQSRFDSMEVVRQTLAEDLSAASNSEVNVTLFGAGDFDCIPFSSLPGECIDSLDIEVDTYTPDHNLLKLASDKVVQETLHSHLLKSNCLITSQPDWASIVISYQGKQIDKAALLKYLISFRDHNEFHEQCVERIYCELWRTFNPEKLSVYARYTRRGGLDINPYRSNEQNKTPYAVRTNRQ